MKCTREWFDEIRIALAQPRMTDRELGAYFGITQQAVSHARRSGMSAELALMVGGVLARLGVVGDAAEVVMSAWIERELRRNSATGHLMRDYWRRHAFPSAKPERVIAPLLPQAPRRGRPSRQRAGL